MTTKTKVSVADFKKALEQGDFQDYGSVFNEQTQTSYTARPFGRLRFTPRVADLLFVPLMISMPFNPTTGQMDDQYNSRKKFRPFVRPDEFLKGIKAMCHEDENLRKRYMDFAGFSGKWDTKETAAFTDADREILFIYRRPMTATHPAVRINSQSITGEKYGGNYLLQTKQNPITGEFEGEISNLHKLGLLSSALQRVEVNSFNNALEQQEADCISLDLGRSFITAKTFTEIKDLNSQEAKTARGQIRSCYPLGQVSPLLVTPMVKVPVEAITGNITEFVTNEKGEEVEQLLPQFRNPVVFEGNLLMTDKFPVLDKINEIAGNAFPKDPSKKKPRNVDADVYANFVILEYITSNETATFDNDQDKMLAAGKLEVSKERTPLFHRKKGWRDGFAELEIFLESMSGFYEFAEKDNFIKRMPELMLSNYKSATEVIEDRGLKVFAEQFNLGEEFAKLFNPDVLAANKEILMELWPEEYAEKFDQIEDKLEEGETEFEKLLEQSGSSELTDEQIEIMKDGEKSDEEELDIEI